MCNLILKEKKIKYGIDDNLNTLSSSIPFQTEIFFSSFREEGKKRAIFAIKMMMIPKKSLWS